MRFATEYLKAVWKALSKPIAIGAGALFAGVGARAGFDPLTVIIAVPISILFMTVLLLTIYLSDWRSIVRNEARRKEISFERSSKLRSTANFHSGKHLKLSEQTSLS